MTLSVAELDAISKIVRYVMIEYDGVKSALQVNLENLDQEKTSQEIKKYQETGEFSIENCLKEE